MVLTIGILCLLCYILKRYLLFFQILGILSACFETTICIPQIISNCRYKATKNISFIMIFSWFLRDCFRLFYNIFKRKPIQYILCISVSLDLIVVIQLINYRKNNYKGKEKVNANKKQIEEINQLMKSIDELKVGK